jgi:capsular exopolysaccharide synthesis family protein
VYEPRQPEGERRPGPQEHTDKNALGRLATISDPTSATADAFHALGANLQYVLMDAPSRVIALTSPGTGEGKTTVCANLGVVLAQADQNVLIVDCDLHRPAMHGVFGLRNLQGLENVLSGERRLDEIQQEPMPGLKVVTTGPLPPYPAELLGSIRFKEFLRQAGSEFGYVLLDCPPVSMVPDSLVLAAQADGVLVVLDAQSTRKVALRRTIHGLESVRSNILGTVMGNVEVGK